MPPKPRGRGGRGGSSTRAGRLGAIAASPNSDAAEAAPPELKKESTESKPEAPTGNEAESGLFVPEEAPSSSTVGSSSSATVAAASPGPQNAAPVARRAGSTRGKKPVAFKPTFTGRRSKQERDAFEKEANQRDKERAAARQKEEAAKKREQGRGNRGRGDRGAQRGRGGYAGVVSGPFSMGNVARPKDKRSENRITTSGSRATRVKREGVDGDGDVSMSGGRGASVKNEKDGYVSSEDDDEGGMPKQNIDAIEISSDEEGPVRIGRREHPERVVGINTESSSEVAGKTSHEGEGAGTAIKIEDGPSTTRKGKGKAKDVEITGVRKPYKGMWAEPEEPEVQVKAEPTSDDEDRMSGMVAGPPDAENEPLKLPVASLETEKKTKARLRGQAEPVLQTDEERAEYERWQTNLHAIRAELGPAAGPTGDATAESTDKDAATPDQPNPRDNNTYLFHFPPRMPDVAHSYIKQEPGTTAQPMPAPAPAASASKLKVKAEEKGERNRPVHGMNVAPGRAGKIKVHESGRAILSWGGERFDLTPGQEVRFMQETLDWDYRPRATRVVKTDAGDSTAFGRVKGKFVVVPSWGRMLK